MDQMEFDIKRALVTSPNAQLQWHKIRDELYPKYELQYEKGSFTTVLHRKLTKLVVAAEIEKNSLSHQEVMYFIPKKNLSKIRNELDRALAHRRFDEIWDSFSPEQRKRETINLLGQSQKSMELTTSFIEEISLILRNNCQSLVEKLNNSENDNLYTEEQRQSLLMQLQTQISDLDKMHKESQKKQLTSENQFNEWLSIVKTFVEKVVEPEFGGDWNKAILFLMKKAIVEQESKVFPKN